MVTFQVSKRKARRFETLNGHGALIFSGEIGDQEQLTPNLLKDLETSAS